MNNPLSQIQQDIMTLLLGDPDLAVVPVYQFKELIVQSLADQAVSIWTDRSGLHKSGTAIEVRLPAIRAKYPNVPGPQLQLEMTIRIFEDPAQNTSGLTAESIGMEVLRWLDGVALDGDIQLTADSRDRALKPVYEYPDRYTYDAIFVSEFPQDHTARVASPVTTDDNSGNVTLTCADPAAAIYCTTDGTMPLIGNPAQLYTAPFVVGPGTIIRSVAWKPGLLPSFIQHDTIII
jgi:hypothetical protein